MSNNYLLGGNNPGNRVSVDSRGQMLARAVTTEEQQDAATRGDTYNLDTGLITLTSDVETPVLMLRNTGEARNIKLSRLTLTAMPSTGGTGPVLASLWPGIVGGTILSSAAAPIKNLNVTSAKVLAADARRGGTGVTFTPSTPEPTLRALFPGTPTFAVAPYDHVVVPQGGSVLIALTPPPGNTSMVVLASILCFLGEGVTA